MPSVKCDRRPDRLHHVSLYKVSERARWYRLRSLTGESGTTHGSDYT